MIRKFDPVLMRNVLSDRSGGRQLRFLSRKSKTYTLHASVGHLAGFKSGY